MKHSKQSYVFIKPSKTKTNFLFYITYVNPQTGRRSGTRTPHTPFFMETPMVASRTSPVSSLSEACLQGNFESEVVSDGSHLSSGRDEDLPDSPSELCVQEEFKKKRVVTTATNNPQVATETSPDMLSGATSFSGLTIPGHGKVRVLGKHGPVKTFQEELKEEVSPEEESKEKEEKMVPPSGEKLATVEEVESNDESGSSSSDQLSDFNDCSDDILQQAIKMGIKSSVFYFILNFFKTSPLIYYN